jgi:hypothetical protein
MYLEKKRQTKGGGVPQKPGLSSAGVVSNSRRVNLAGVDGLYRRCFKMPRRIAFQSYEVGSSFYSPRPQGIE